MNDIIIPDEFTTVDEFMTFMGKVQTFKKAVKEVEERFNAAAIAYVQANKFIEVGTLKFWVDHDKETVYVDDDTQDQLIEFILENWAVDEMKALLCSGAFKHGAFKKFLLRDATAQAETMDDKPTKEEIEAAVDRTYSRYFKTITKDKLKSGEALPKRLQKLDTKFVTT